MRVPASSALMSRRAIPCGRVLGRVTVGFRHPCFDPCSISGSILFHYYANGINVESRSSVYAHQGGEAVDFDGPAFVEPAGDCFVPVMGFELKGNHRTFTVDDAGRAGHMCSQRRRRQVIDFDARADGDFARLQKRQRCVQGRMFQKPHQPRRRQNLRRPAFAGSFTVACAASTVNFRSPVVPILGGVCISEFLFTFHQRNRDRRGYLCWLLFEERGSSPLRGFGVLSSRGLRPGRLESG